MKYHAYGFPFTMTTVSGIAKGKPYAWYFISKKDGSLLRKSENNLHLGTLEKKLCKDRQEGEPQLCAVWMPMASQFPEARCHSSFAEFLSVNGCRHFMANMKATHSGILQAFVEPHGVSN